MSNFDKISQIYVDNAATTVVDPEALDCMMSVMSESYSNPSQPYVISKKVRSLIEESRVIIAKCINADPEEIFFTSGGTESDNWVIKGTFNHDSNCNQIITSEIEHAAILNACKYMCEFGEELTFLHPDACGVISPEELEKTITSRTRLVSIMYANNEIGTVQPISKLCDVAHKHGVLFHTDAVQAIGHLKIDVRECEVDFLSASAHKFNGPKGIGFLYIRKGVSINPLLHGGGQENSLRSGTENASAIKAMAVALRNNCKNMQYNQEYITKLEGVLLSNLDSLDVKYQRNGHVQRHLPGLLSLSFKNEDGESLLYRLNLNGIFVSTGSACNGRSTEISHVLRAIKTDENMAKGTIRISIGKNNTVLEMKYLADCISKCLKLSK